MSATEGTTMTKYCIEHAREPNGNACARCGKPQATTMELLLAAAQAHTDATGEQVTIKVSPKR